MGTNAKCVHTIAPGQEGWIQTERSECLKTGWWMFQELDVPTN
jgi:hypothetical protein